MKISETNLYEPVKEFLNGLGFDAKGEICGCDVVALDKSEPVAVIICVYVSVFNMLIAASIALCVHNEAVYLNVGKNVKMLRLYFAV